MRKKLKDLTLKDNFLFGAVMAQEEYAKLPDTFVIFICDYDPFGGGYYRYTFQTVCREDASQELREGCSCIFLNTLGSRPELVTESLVRFLKYVHADLEESEEDFQDTFVKQLQRTVRQIKENREMEERYMVFEEMLRDERSEGRAEGRAESVLELLRLKGKVSAELEEKIRSQKDTEILAKWLLLAAGAETVQEFEKKMD